MKWEYIERCSHLRILLQSTVLDNFQIKRLRNTTLGERLFIIFDVNTSGNIYDKYGC